MKKAHEIEMEIQALKSQYRQAIELERKEKSSKMAKTILKMLASLEGSSEEDKQEMLITLLESHAQDTSSSLL